MNRVHNFNAGPSILPQDVIREASKAMINYHGNRLSILEMSHRSVEVENIMEEASELVSELLGLPQKYKVLFLTGGASSQFYMVPLNLLSQKDTAAYINTGRWSEKAMVEARRYGEVVEVASSADDGYASIPAFPELEDDFKYLHITTNNTVVGTQFHDIPNVSCPLVADMSSDIFTRKISVDKFGLIYAGAQKNMGPAGTTLVIINEDILGKVDRDIPTMLNYMTHIKKKSAYNTPPVYAIYVSLLYLRWMKNHGGIPKMRERSKHKAELLYAEIDRNTLFEGKVKRDARSLMNVTFLAKNERLEKAFLKKCQEMGIVGIQGHRSVGGFRASLYNAMPIESVMFLVKLMQIFEQESS